MISVCHFTIYYLRFANVATAILFDKEVFIISVNANVLTLQYKFHYFWVRALPFDSPT